MEVDDKTKEDNKVVDIKSKESLSKEEIEKKELLKKQKESLKVLGVAESHDPQALLVVGISKDGEPFFCSNFATISDIVYFLRYTEHKVFER